MTKDRATILIWDFITEIMGRPLTSLEGFNVGTVWQLEYDRCLELKTRDKDDKIIREMKRLCPISTGWNRLSGWGRNPGRYLMCLEQGTEGIKKGLIFQKD